MNIGLYMGRLDPQQGGGFTFQQQLLDAAIRGHGEHALFVFHYGPARHDTAPGITFVRLADPISRIPLMRRILDRLGRRRHPSILDRAAAGLGIDLMWFFDLGFEPVEIPYAYTVWDLEHRKQPYFPEVSHTGWTRDQRESLFRETLPGASMILTGTECGRQEIVKFYGVDERLVHVLPLPAPPAAAIPANADGNIGRISITAPYLFYPAQFWPHKNHIVILEALSLLRQQGTAEFSAVFTGSDKGNLGYIRAQIARLGLEDTVHIPGFVSRDELAALYRGAFALVYPTLFGPDNLPPLEAFALGCPVLVAEIPGAREQLGAAPLYFSPTSERDLAKAILGLSRNPVLRKRMIASGLARARRWTADDYVQGFLSIAREFQSYRRCWDSGTGYVHT
ncbi:MAG TPA: glycosyltransferase family 1 protein [Spirochaetota bacterium]|nr:glycosyltransferase family 1 protein [Spirochaetota bacterium]HNT11670.1 glycosyltransferase family 1 protein [Spirochaetota bacterium]